MIRLASEKSGQSYRGKAGHRRPAEKAQVANASQNAPFDDTTGRRAYMRTDMRKRCQRERAVYDKKEQPVKERKPPPGERKARWGGGADKLKAIAEEKIDDERRVTVERLAQDYEHLAMTAPGYWMGRTGGVLRPAVVAYLHGGDMTSTELMALQAYLKRSITAPNWQSEGAENLRERAEGLDTREKLEAWLDDALDIGIDPL